MRESTGACVSSYSMILTALVLLQLHRIAMAINPTSLTSNNRLHIRPGEEHYLIKHAEKLLERLDQVEPHVRAFIPEEDRAERLLQETESLQSRYDSGENHPLPLYGMFLGVKDLFGVHGFETRAGSELPSHLFEGVPRSCG